MKNKLTLTFLCLLCVNTYAQQPSKPTGSIIVVPEIKFVPMNPGSNPSESRENVFEKVASARKKEIFSLNIAKAEAGKAESAKIIALAAAESARIEAIKATSTNDIAVIYKAAEAAKMEASKAEVAKLEAIKAAKTAKAEVSNTEIAKADAEKAEAAMQESVKAAEAAKAEAAKAEAAKAEAAKAEAAKAE